MTNLAMVLRLWRKNRRLTMRAAAKEIGVSWTTIHYLESRTNYRSDVFLKVIRWLSRRSK